jgi:hypothetical protein
MEDLEKEAKAWLATGNHIIIGGDLNGDIFGDNITELFQNKLHMNDLIYCKHPREEAPVTHIRNGNHKTIDGLWGTQSIQVKACGYLEADAFFPGDHAVVWADIYIDSALGGPLQEPSTMEARRLTLQDSKSVKNYLKIYTSLVKKHDLINRTLALQDSIIPGQPLTEAQVAEANEIDRIRTICMLKAEKKCHKFNTGAVEFSDVTDGPRKAIDFWNTAIRRRCGVKVSSRLWQRKKKKAHIEEDIGELSLDELRQRLSDARKEYRQARKGATEARKKFIETFDPEDRDRILRTEEQRRLGRLARQITGKAGDSGVTTVIYNGQEYTQQGDIERITMQVNEAKVHASKDTPFLQQPLRSIYGNDGKSPAVIDVLNGTYTRQIADAYSELLLEHMCMPHGQMYPPKLPTWITPEDHIKAWKCAKERTSGGPSGLTFGMFKANCQDPELAAMDAALRNIAYQTGHIYPRWLGGIDCQLLKRSKDKRVEKMRTILCLEADCNMNNKKFGRELMWTAEANGTLTRDNYGGRKGLRAVETSLNQYLT